MRFEWHSRKERSNLLRHGVTFEEAVSVFYDPLSATVPDPDHSEAESRYITIGHSESGRMLFVCHTSRHGSERIISARLATRQERKRHEEQG